MPGVECGLNEEDTEKDDGEGKIGNSRRLAQGLPCDEDEYGSNEKNGSEALEEVADNLLEPMGRRRRRSVLAMLCEFARHLFCREALRGGGRKTLVDLVDRDGMPIETRQF